MARCNLIQLPRIFAKLLISLLATFFTLVLVEQYLKIKHYQPNPLHIEVASKSDARFYHVFEDRQFIYDPQLIWKPRPGFDIFNSQGFRGQELSSNKPAGSYRIFAIGDSNTLGWRGKARAWPAYLQNTFMHAGKNVTVINAGVYGYTSYQGLLRFRQCLAFQPDLVLISFGANDGHQVNISDRDFVHSGISNVKIRQFLHRYRLGKMLLLTLSRFSNRQVAELKARVDPNEYRANLTEIARIAKQKNIQVALLTRPYTGASNNPLLWKKYAPQYNQITAQVAEQEKVLLIDVYSYFKDKREYFADESHFSVRGHQVAAKMIYEALSSSGLAHPVHRAAAESEEAGSRSLIPSNR